MVPSLVFLANPMCRLIDKGDLLVEPFALHELFENPGVVAEWLGEILFLRQKSPWPAQGLLRPAQDQQVWFCKNVPQTSRPGNGLFDLRMRGEKCLDGVALFPRPDGPHLAESLL